MNKTCQNCPFFNNETWFCEYFTAKLNDCNENAEECEGYIFITNKSE